MGGRLWGRSSMARKREREKGYKQKDIEEKGIIQIFVMK